MLFRPRAMALAILAALLLLGPHNSSFAARSDFGNPWEANPNLVWNWRLPASTPTDPNSAAFRAAVVAALRKPGDFGVQDSIWSNTRGFTAPVYVVDASTPKTPVDFGGGWHGSTNPDGTRRVVRDSDVLYGDPNRARMLLDALNGTDRAGVRIPAAAQSSPAADHEMVIYDTTNDTLYEFWNILRPGETVHDIEPLIGPATQTNPTNHFQTMTAGVMPNFSTTATGRFIDTPGHEPGLWGTAATGLTYTGGRITPLDLQRGEIRHAIDIALPYNVHADRFVWPASRKDYGDCAACVAEGQRVRLPSNVDLSGVTNPLARTVAVALRDYGGIINDTSGKVSIRFDSAVGFTSMGEPDPWPGLFSQLGVDMTPADPYQKQANLRAAFAQIPFEQFEFLPGGWRPTGTVVPTPATTSPVTTTTQPANSTVTTAPTTRPATTSTAPATTAPTTRPQTTTTVPATTVPATTVPATTVPATTAPATTAPTTTSVAPETTTSRPSPPPTGPAYGPIADAPSAFLPPPPAPTPVAPAAAAADADVAAADVAAADVDVDVRDAATAESSSALASTVVASARAVPAASASTAPPAPSSGTASTAPSTDVPTASSGGSESVDVVQPSVAVNLTAADGSPIAGVRLSARNLCRVFIEPRLSWADPDIAADNPDTALPDLPVSPVANEGDGSAMAVKALANYCMANAPEQWARWAEQVGADRTRTQTFSAELLDRIDWPTAVLSIANTDDPGALAVVASHPGSIALLMSSPPMPDGVVIATLTESLRSATEASREALRPTAATLLRSPLSPARGNPWVPRTITVGLITAALFLRRRIRGKDQPSRLM